MEAVLPPKNEPKLSSKVRYEQVVMEEYQPSDHHSQKRSHGHHHGHSHGHEMGEESDGEHQTQCRMQ